MSNSASTVPDDIDPEIEALRQQLAEEDAKMALAEKRREVPEIERLRGELAEKKRAREDREIVEKLEDKYGKLNVSIASYRCPEGLLVVKKPNHLTHKDISNKSAKGGGTVGYDDMDLFVRRSLIHPLEANGQAGGAFNAIRDERPGVVNTLFELVIRLSGAQAAEQQGK